MAGAQAEGEAVPAGSVWTPSLEKAAWARVARDGRDAGDEKGMQGGRAAAGSTWRWERLAPRPPSPRRLCAWGPCPAWACPLSHPLPLGSRVATADMFAPGPGRGHNMSPAEPACVCLGGGSTGPASTLPGCGVQVFLVAWRDDFVLKGVAGQLENGFWG